MEMTMLTWLFNPGDKVCDLFKINGEHRFIARLFVNIHWYGHFAVWFAYLYSEQFPY
jgi:hypothetical protein